MTVDMCSVNHEMCVPKKSTDSDFVGFKSDEEQKLRRI